MDTDIVKNMNLSDDVKSYWEGQEERLEDLNEKFQKRLKSKNISENMIDSAIESKNLTTDSNLPAGRKFLINTLDKIEQLFTDDISVDLKEKINNISDSLENKNNISDSDVIHSPEFKDWKKHTDQEYQEGMQQVNGNQLSIDFGRYLGYSGAAISMAGVAAGAVSVAGLAVGFATVAGISTLIHKKNQNKAERLETNFEDSHEELLKNILEPDTPSNEQDLENELKSEISGNKPNPEPVNDLSPDEMSMAEEISAEVDQIQPRESNDKNRSKQKNRM